MQGCLVADRYAQSRRLILSALDFIEAHNNALAAVPRPPVSKLSMDVFTPVRMPTTPRDFLHTTTANCTSTCALFKDVGGRRNGSTL